MKQYIVFLLCILPACQSTKKVSEPEPQATAVINLVTSTRIIRALIADNKIGQVLEDHDPEQLTILLDNVSPAQMAFEAEALGKEELSVVYYYKDSPQEQAFIQALEPLALAYVNRVRFVAIDADKLFSLTEDTEIAHYPTLLIIKNREIVDTITQNITLDTLQQKLDLYLAQ